jgi:ribosomal protein S12 methylthiotransferase accessory factor
MTPNSSLSAWSRNAYTGLFRSYEKIPARPHDPAVVVCGGVAAPWREGDTPVDASGIGWDEVSAEAACVGEAIERLQAYPLPDDRLLEASFADWPLEERAIAPDRWVLFRAEQYRQPGFPFVPFTAESRVDWVCCREALTGAPWWVPSDMVFLHPRCERPHGIAPGLSTGLTAGRAEHPILLRGLQEAIERDAVVGAWWGAYDLEEFRSDDVLAGLGPERAERIRRPNLRYRCFRVCAPFSEQVAIVALEGEDREGFCFSVGSACRETLSASWEKAILEAIHGRFYVRYLKSSLPETTLPPATFAEHAVHYSRHPERLRDTVLGASRPLSPGSTAATREDLGLLVRRLGPTRPVLFRDMTPPALTTAQLGWRVLRVVVPGLQPLHGNHLLAHLGGPLARALDVETWSSALPHPFP